MQLYGSDTSPYARRLRIWLEAEKLPFNYTHLDIFSTEGRAVLREHNPAKKIPFLVDGSTVICDSNVIFRYVSQKFQLSALTWQQENALTYINACNDSFVELLLCQRSGFNTNDDKLFFNLQRERVASLLELLDKECIKPSFINCSYLAISLYCLLDWIAFRSLWPMDNYPALQACMQQLSKTLPLASSDPRN
ncbi:Glutathione S-transferase, N-terminal domain [Pseudoalteromonas luteoviolacea B = ATCC 29581]|nr:Glutathione S-transferase, N-terminal domain [Pseudoalteromonas luteoviolacea B = ATCC 29581]